MKLQCMKFSETSLYPFPFKSKCVHHTTPKHLRLKISNGVPKVKFKYFLKNMFNECYHHLEYSAV
jgi:hypothetical protein